MNVENIYELATLSFEDFLMAHESLYYDEESEEYVSFNKIIVSPPIHPFLGPSISGFEPERITAGTKSILTITGTGFGTEKGKVVFPDGDARPGFFWVTETDPVDIVQWTNELIKVEVPSVEAGAYSGSPAATGSFKVVLPDDGGEAESGTPLFIDYAVFNFRKASTNEGVFLNISDNEAGDGDADGTLYFWLDDGLNGTPNARMVVEKALCNWNEKTNIKWGLKPLSSSNTTFGDFDNVNLLYFAGEEEFTGALEMAPAKTIIVIDNRARLQACQPSAEPFLREVDIAFREDPINADPGATGGWNFSLMDEAAPDEMDFYSTILHELGHAHLLMHAKFGQIMAPILGVGDNERTIQEFDKMGGQYVLATSSSNYDDVICPSNIAKVKQEAFCSLDATEEKARTLGLKVNSILHDNRLLIENIQEEFLELEACLYGLLGQKLWLHTLSLTPKENSSILVDTPLPSGCYFLSVTEKGNKVRSFGTYKLVKP